MSHGNGSSQGKRQKKQLSNNEKIYAGTSIEKMSTLDTLIEIGTGWNPLSIQLLIHAHTLSHT